MNLTDRQKAYWRANLRITGALLASWVLITFGAGYFARELNEYTFLGFPLAFYIFSQGALIAFLAIIGIHVRLTRRLDRRFGVAERKWRHAGKD